MTESTSAVDGPSDLHEALFAQLIMQQSNMAWMLMGKIAHPESGKAVKDLDAARLFIDQLEMLQAKTRGNLNKQEEALLKQSLMSLQMSFVEAVESESKPSAPPEQKSPETPTAPPVESGSQEDHPKKFSKKY